MNRRNFFKTVTAFVVGVYAAFVPKAQAEPENVLTLAKLMKAKEALDATINDDFLIPIDDGLDEAFCYGGKLFRVYPDYFDKGFVRMRLREDKREFNYVLTNEEYNNRQYRNCICEYMLAKFYKQV